MFPSMRDFPRNTVWERAEGDVTAEKLTDGKRDTGIDFDGSLHDFSHSDSHLRRNGYGQERR